MTCFFPAGKTYTVAYIPFPISPVYFHRMCY